MKLEDKGTGEWYEGISLDKLIKHIKYCIKNEVSEKKKEECYAILNRLKEAIGKTLNTVSNIQEPKNLSISYRKLPVIIEAIQYTGENGSSLYNWSNGEVFDSPILEPTKDNPSGKYVQVKTLEGVMTGNVGDYIIKGVNGEFYPCKPDIFNKTYEKVESYMGI